ncbi:CGNR zinc finger domain-containing protein [Acidisarcina polymorpha]|uniref:CGNR zinc finger domain-containing protein n=1 Tax=Acidisarcina polymorpha TaxID=2211140 RepID=UPI000DEF2D04
MSTDYLTKSGNRIVELLNSRGVGFDGGVDRLATPTSALSLCRLFRAGLKSVDKATLDQLRELRQALLMMLKPTSSRVARKSLDEIAASTKFTLGFSEPSKATWSQISGNAVVGTVLQDCANLINTGQLDRLKICANEACAAAFYDLTRSKTQRWHSYALCGNKSNVAAFRSRHS